MSYSNSAVKFAPVVVNKGRLFRGHGFLVAEIESSYEGAFWRQVPNGMGLSGCHWTRTIHSHKAKIWVPELGKFCYANMKYVEDSDVMEPVREIEFQKYCEKMIADTISYCKKTLSSKGATVIYRNELINFTKRCLWKYHKEIENSLIDEMLNSTVFSSLFEDVVDDIMAEDAAKYSMRMSRRI
jgi:hypothetical protein